MSRISSWMAVVVLCGSAPVALAQERVYRCGPDASAYSHEPCADGRGIVVADPRTAQQAAQARQVALREVREADALERQRLQAEKLAARLGPVLIGPSLKSVRLDDSHCVNEPTCARGEHKQRRHNKTQAVTLYRGVDPR